MRIMDEQIRKRWRALQAAMTDEIFHFASACDRIFEQGLGVAPFPGTAAVLRDRQQRRQLWLQLWCRIADMISAHEAGYVRAFPQNAEWASQAVEFLRANLLEFQRKLRVQHSDMPEIVELRLDPATERHYATVAPFVAGAKGMPS
jgi:hypothetical protein